MGMIQVLTLNVLVTFGDSWQLQKHPWMPQDRTRMTVQCVPMGSWYPMPQMTFHATRLKPVLGD